MSVLLYTDGVTDIRNSSEEMFQRSRLKSFLIENGDKPTKALSNLLLEKLNKFGEGMPQFDDITAVAIKTTATK